MARSTISIAVPPQMRAFVDQRLKGGSFGNVSEYFRHLVREDQKRTMQERFEALILEGERSGPGKEVDAKYWARTKASLLAKAKKARRK